MCMSRIIYVLVGYMYEYLILEKKIFFYKCEDIILILNFIYCSCNEI